MGVLHLGLPEWTDYHHQVQEAKREASMHHKTGETIYDLIRLPEEEIRRRFKQLKARLPHLYRDILPYRHTPRTVVVIPSLTLDQEVLSKIKGINYYEERLLYYLMMLQLPRTQVIFVTSQAIDSAIVDYFLNLLPGVPGSHARRRLTLLYCHDASSLSLTEKILQRPRLIQRIRSAIQYPEAAYMECFNSTPLERRLSVYLGIPLYANDPDLDYLGSKSWNRRIFREAGVPHPDGFEDLRDEQDVAQALVALKRRHPELRRVVVKLNEGFSGEGNALFDFTGAPEENLEDWVKEELPRRLHFENPEETYERFMRKFEEMQGIAEVFIEGENKRSPSVQGLINPLGEGTIVSTHEQILGGPTKQVYLGAAFPALRDYRLTLHEAGRKIGRVLSRKGSIGRFAVDFVTVQRKDGGWDIYALEINLRKGGTTHPFMTLRFLTHGEYNLEDGVYYTGTGQPRYYYATDNIYNPAYKGLTPEDLMDISVCEGLHFHAGTQEGVVFHLVGALSEHGKLGVVSIGATPERAEGLYHKTIEALDRVVQDGGKCQNPPRSEEEATAPTHFHPWWRPQEDEERT